MFTFTAENQCDHISCGHNHRSYEAAIRCLNRLYKLPHTPGAAIRIFRYHGKDSNGEKGTQTNYQGR